VALMTSGARMGPEDTAGNQAAPLVVGVPGEGTVTERLARFARTVASARAAAPARPTIAVLQPLFRPAAAAGLYRVYMAHQRRLHTGGARRCRSSGNPPVHIGLTTGPKGLCRQARSPLPLRRGSGDRGGRPSTRRNDMGGHGHGRTVVAGVDGSECGLQAVRWAAVEAARRQRPLRLVAAHTWVTGGILGDPGVGPDPEAVLRQVSLGQLALAAAAAERVAPGLDVERVEVTGLAVPVLQAESTTAELVVVGDRGVGGFTGLLLGSVAVELSAHASCPVVVVRGPEPEHSATGPAPVVVGVDGSPTSEAAVAFAFEEASLRQAPLVAVHVWQDLLVEPTLAPLVDWDALESDERAVLAERLAGWAGKYPDVRVSRRVVRDRPAAALVDESGGAQLVVVGSRGRGGFRGLLLGSVSQALLHHARCPVAVVRPTDADRSPGPA
jgi:nucleotide-binding universal stress UspA family protein